ncbi:hypothetical protein [Paenibacillus xylanilyticus]|uniref:hypothetical protein n=1 Tax=Paenibacillus xylanilyticus TaxID=248903 RepID=UPI00138982AA|nr:hypothetical protein [Paenibacillus xylanilyticus]
MNILDMHGDAADLNLSDLVGRAERYSAQDPGRTVHRVSFMLNGWFLIERVGERLMIQGQVNGCTG